jgi:hypothetical protein
MISGILAFSIMLCGLGISPASALVKIDFEQKYFVHPGLQTWDFSLIRSEDTYHIFYHTARVGEFNVTGADTIWHSTSLDLANWTIEGPIITAGQGAWDANMTWAPDVFRDEENNRYGIAYTGVDDGFNQRICFAFSSDLYNWTRSEANPIIIPNADDYIWDKDGTWSDFRDPYVYRENGQWHVLVTAKKQLDVVSGVLYHGVSDDLETWVDVGYLFANDGDEPYLVLESPQYHIWGDYHHLLFGEYNTAGISAVKSRDLNTLSMDSRVIIDAGYAPEVDDFDPGIEIFSRLAVYDHPQTGVRNYVIRLDTLTVDPTGSVISVYKPGPLYEDFEYVNGMANLANPIFGDNPDFRGEEPAGTVGHGYYGSAEYFQGPLAGRGSPGSQIGSGARGELRSYPFIIEGDKMDLLVGGGYYPETCYVALMDAVADTIIYSETGAGTPPMSPRQWDLSGLTGRQAYIKILDDEMGAMGFINIDEIIESSSVSAVIGNPLPGQFLVDHGAFPNPFNPMTTFRFSLTENREIQIKVFDLRGLEIWNSGSVAGSPGLNNVTWQGVGSDGQLVPAGIYLYSIESQGLGVASGKLSLVK